MIEKEVKNAQEGPLVASVLTNRLEKGMPLACDATIIYAMKLAGTYKGRLGKADMTMKSPYNTYLHGICPLGRFPIRARTLFVQRSIRPGPNTSTTFPGMTGPISFRRILLRIRMP